MKYRQYEGVKVNISKARKRKRDTLMNQTQTRKPTNNPQRQIKYLESCECASPWVIQAPQRRHAVRQAGAAQPQRPGHRALQREDNYEMGQYETGWYRLQELLRLDLM